jgi:hypothetical protein
MEKSAPHQLGEVGWSTPCAAGHVSPTVSGLKPLGHLGFTVRVCVYIYISYIYLSMYVCICIIMYNYVTINDCKCKIMW